ncbi:MAG TPA: ABC transporter permease [Xanthobacteraceae bacterium]|nr:ABC transporter permease [Xanthobacteraceae bacterium]
MKNVFSNKWILRILSLMIVIAVWQIVGARINPVFLSTPAAIVEAGTKVILNGELPRAMLVSLAVVFAGFFAAIVVGVPLGLLMGRSRHAEFLLDPYVNALYVVPRIALIPLIIVWLGLGVQAQIAVVFGTSVFPILISTQTGVKNVSQNLMETATSFGAKEYDLVMKVVLPASVPFIMSGLRLGIGQAIIGMIVAQMFLGISGMGFMLVNYGNQFATNYVFVVVLALAALGVFLTEIVRQIEARFSHWKTTTGTA